MANITQTITNFPTPPDSSNDTPTEFNTKADAFVNHQGNVYTTEVNTWATQANGLKDDMNVIKTDIAGIVATIPAGSINDGQISNKKVWSSAKTNNILNQKQNIDPKFGIESTQESTEWITKFPDGTCMLYATRFTTPATATFNFNYPADAFILEPSVSITIVNGTYGYHGITQHTTSSKDKMVAIKYKRSDGSASSDAITINVHAIGRWK